MADKIDSQAWTGAIEPRKQVPLDSPEAKAAIRGTARTIAIVLAAVTVVAVIAKGVF